MIETDEKLAAWLPKLRAAKWVALDTEADSLHAYPEKVCLIQISTADGDRLVDPLAKINLDPLLDALNAHELIMHGADYDLRLLRKHHEFTPSAIFDTMLAARLVGEWQFGLSSLVEKFLGVKLDKGSQKADWARRPLTEKMEIYARNDTHYLQPLADKLKLELQRKDRLAWHQESCARLIAECSQPPVVDGDSVWRIKGSSHLSRPAFAVLRELWHWRENEAVAANRPPFFISRTKNSWILPPRRSSASRWRIFCRRECRRAGAMRCSKRSGPGWRFRRTGSRKSSGTSLTVRTRPSAAVTPNWPHAATPTPANWELTRRSSPANPRSATWRAIGTSTRRN